MPDDLRRALARHELQRKQDESDELENKRQADYSLQQFHQEQRVGGREWTPGSWQAASLWNKTAPKPRFPIIIGSESIFKGAEELGAFFNMPEEPTITETWEVDLNDVDLQSPTLELKTSALESRGNPYTICDIGSSQSFELENLTQGKHVLVSFQGKARDAWLPQAWKDSGKGGGPESSSTTTTLDVRNESDGAVHSEQAHHLEAHLSNPNRRPIKSLKDLGIPLD
ncbi:hypothetical protein QBC41DRAFT_327834 [Cercophora samala]|uniref:Uncharacterized protein n=1 Tax=Cercophora samala TaxID=330535 RepID=A0AA39Z777_9PEZI|nr:hypothetical protein QBC41DRAFT_327834 [Cercophora samala]